MENHNGDSMDREAAWQGGYGLMTHADPMTRDTTDTNLQESGFQTTTISLEQVSAVIGAIQAAASSPGRWLDAGSTVAGLMTSCEEGAPVAARGWKNATGVGEIGCEAAQRCEDGDASAQREVWRGRLALVCLDRFAVAALIVDGAGAVLHLNASARNLLDTKRFMAVGRSGLRFNQRTLHAAFEAALRRATQTLPRSSLLPIRFSGEDFYELTVSPLEQAMGTPSSNYAVPLAVVLIPGPRPDGKSVAQRGRQLYGLTEAESRVMAGLTLGRTVDEIAIEHGVRASTVRAQVRTIFEKTGVNRQSDLVRLALTGASFLEPDV